MGEKLITENRRARHDYHILDSLEAGIVLSGTEVKSIRMTNSLTLKDAYADIRKGEMYLVGAHIQPYEMGNIYNHEPERMRKLLVHRSEILKLGQQTAEKGLTLIPLRVYFKNGMVKVQIGLCRGKNTVDKRDTIQARDTKREMDRVMKSFNGRNRDA